MRKLPLVPLFSFALLAAAGAPPVQADDAEEFCEDGGPEEFCDDFCADEVSEVGDTEECSFVCELELEDRVCEEDEDLHPSCRILCGEVCDVGACDDERACRERCEERLAEAVDEYDD
jgi:hypothetical protein